MKVTKSGDESTVRRANVKQKDLELAHEFARRLADNVKGQNLQVILYGSRARGDADDESDLDLFVSVEGDDSEGRIKETARRVASTLTIEHGVLVVPFIADQSYRKNHAGYLLLELVKQEGVAL